MRHSALSASNTVNSKKQIETKLSNVVSLQKTFAIQIWVHCIVATSSELEIVCIDLSEVLKRTLQRFKMTAISNVLISSKLAMFLFVVQI